MERREQDRKEQRKNWAELGRIGEQARTGECRRRDGERMFCAISGQAPSHGVVSKKSGQVYERSLIEAYLAEHLTDPVTGEESSPEDLVDLKMGGSAAPRAANMTSIPSLLALFQSEWDGVAMETFALKTQLAQIRQQLSVALYENDAASRLLARLMQERDEARDALAKFSAVQQSGEPPAAGDDDDNTAIPEGVVPLAIRKEVERAHKANSARRKQNKMQDESELTVNMMKGATWTDMRTTLEYYSGPVFCGSSECIVAGGDKQGAMVELTLDQLQEQTRPMLDAAWINNTLVCLSEDVMSVHGHEGAVAVDGHFVDGHPNGDLLAYANRNGEWGLVRAFASSLKIVCTFRTGHSISGMQFHPDGHLLAFATPDAVRIYSVSDGQHAADLRGPVTAMAFSDNGYHLAVGGGTQVQVWDLRSQTVAHTLELEDELVDMCMEHSGHYLAAAGTKSLRLWLWSVSKKEFTLIHSFSSSFQHITWPCSHPLMARNGSVMSRLEMK